MKLKLTKAEQKALRSVMATRPPHLKEAGDRVYIKAGRLYCTDIHRLVCIEVPATIPDGEYDIGRNFISLAEDSTLPAADTFEKTMHVAGMRHYPCISLSEINAEIGYQAGLAAVSFRPVIQTKYLHAIDHDSLKIVTAYLPVEVLKPSIIINEGVAWCLMPLRAGTQEFLIATEKEAIQKKRRRDC